MRESSIDISSTSPLGVLPHNILWNFHYIHISVQQAERIRCKKTLAKKSLETQRCILLCRSCLWNSSTHNVLAIDLWLQRAGSRANHENRRPLDSHNCFNFRLFHSRLAIQINVHLIHSWIVCPIRAFEWNLHVDSHWASVWVLNVEECIYSVLPRLDHQYLLSFFPHLLAVFLLEIQQIWSPAQIQKQR